MVLELSPGKRKAVLDVCGIKCEQPKLTTTRKMRSDALTDEQVTEIEEFYRRDDISQMMPGNKDFVSVKLPDRPREHRQKRNLLYKISETHELFKEESRVVINSAQEFAQVVAENECQKGGLPNTLRDVLSSTISYTFPHYQEALVAAVIEEHVSFGGSRAISDSDLKNLSAWLGSMPSLPMKKLFLKCGYPTTLCPTTWHFYVNSKDEIPQQTTAYDCGVYVCMYARSLALSCPLVLDANPVIGAACFDWPRRDDIAIIHTGCILYAPVHLKGNCPFTIPVHSDLEESHLFVKRQNKQKAKKKFQEWGILGNPGVFCSNISLARKITAGEQ
ncbi:predicted protein [Nematostella vectensis]|uniref:Ubiquitin-like protease family profile domain-containing protein n=1 Tax=Nematostella vectensis TaxID=45351 RepID=A7SNQ3_NEMVE|nr:predicted protein [Nematostella vectensis]|eukprot:XP_001626756.1 predicted protein [Nematostella vectensis]